MDNSTALYCLAHGAQPLAIGQCLVCGEPLHTQAVYGLLQGQLALLARVEALQERVEALERYVGVKQEVEPTACSVDEMASWEATMWEAMGKRA